MCGISGIILKERFPEEGTRAALDRSLHKMIDAIRHRGPDGTGYWISPMNQVALAHARLAIIDLSDSAAQPMQYPPTVSDEIQARYTITYNGEIYNYQELRSELSNQGYRFRTQSDTEVILAAYDYWQEDCLRRFDGMFAFAIWDSLKENVFAARDRFGEKPFYYFADDQQLLFASEMKALWAVGVERTPNNRMMANFMALGYVQNADDKKQTFFDQIASLPPAHYLMLHLPTFTYHLYPYWKLEKDSMLQISTDDAVDMLGYLFRQSVQRRLRSDVALGCSLSGGLDSSSIAATIGRLRPDAAPLHSFSAIFPGFERDESSKIASMVAAEKLQSDVVQPDVYGLIRNFETLLYHQEEPVSSSSAYAQYSVFGIAAEKNVTVLLDGQGADEILAGYPKYIHWYLQQLVDRNHFSAARAEREQFTRNGIPVKWGMGNYFAAVLPAHAAIHLEQREYFRIARQPDFSSDFSNSLRGHEWEGIHKPIITKLNDILYFNTMVLGLEELLRYADRNSMAHGREVRLPFLSHELVEFIFRLPAHLKIHEGYTKWILRKAMAPYLPESIAWHRPKTGFEPPQQQWMKAPPMQEYLRAAQQKLVDHGILRREVLAKPIIPLDAYAPSNYAWRYLCIAHLI